MPIASRPRRDGHAHRFVERAEVRVDDAGVGAQDDQLAGLIGRDEERAVELVEDRGKVGRVNAAQRRWAGVEQAIGVPVCVYAVVHRQIPCSSTIARVACPRLLGVGMYQDSIMATKFKRCKRYNDPGHAHELTFSCYRRQPFLNGDRSRQWFIDAIEKARKRHSFHLWAYVIMPEHAHVLVWPTRSPYDISSILSTIKLPVTRRAQNFVREHAPNFLETDGRCAAEWRRALSILAARRWIRSQFD